MSGVVPKLRFSGGDAAAYPDTKEKLLGEITKWSSGGTPSKDMPEYWDGDIPWISATTMHHPVVKDSPIRVTKIAIGRGTRIAPVNSILLLVRGSMLYNRIPVCIAARDVAFNQDVKALVCDEQISTKYLFYWLNAKESLIMSMVTGTGIGAGKLETSEMQGLSVSLPTLAEQQKIAAFLGAVDGRIAGLRRAEAGLVRFKVGLMQRLFSQKLRFTQDDGSAFPDWEEKRLGDVAEINPRTRNLPDEFFYIDLESVTAGTLSDPDWISLVGAPSRAQRLLTDGDILFQMVRPYQRNNLHFKLSGQYVGSTGYAQLRARDDSEFLFQSLHEEMFVNKVIERCTGTGYPSINSSDLAEILLPYPHPDEQRKIAAALSALDAKITATRAQITKTERFKQGLLQQMFV